MFLFVIMRSGKRSEEKHGRYLCRRTCDLFLSHVRCMAVALAIYFRRLCDVLPSLVRFIASAINLRRLLFRVETTVESLGHADEVFMKLCNQIGIFVIFSGIGICGTKFLAVFSPSHSF